MTIRLRSVALACNMVAVLTSGWSAWGASSPATPPAFAYPLNPDGSPKPPADKGRLLHTPGSRKNFHISDLNDRFRAPDWRPDQHPAMPAIVATGRKPEVFACGFCHQPNGQGRSENAALAGLPRDYIIEQLAEMKAGRRQSAEPHMRAPALMLNVAQQATPAEVATAAGYFSSLTYRPWIRVVETDRAPRTYVGGVSALFASSEGGTEPLGSRIIEIPEDARRVELRDPTASFVAYVPRGSLARGRRIAESGGGKTTACVACHGADLKGAGSAPPLAGRSPSYLVRQLFDIQVGARSGPAVVAMKGVVAPLNLADMVDVTAYAASRKP